MNLFGFEITEELMLRFIKFCVVGVSGTAIDFGLTWIFKEKMKMKQYVANATGFGIAATSNYFLNRIWTFESHSTDVVGEYLRFMVIAIIGLIINSIILYLAQTKLKKGFWISKMIATGITLVWNFFGSKAFTFNK